LLALQSKTTEWAAAGTPVPASETLTGELVALLLIVTLPVWSPLDAGVKVVVKTVDWPGLKMSPLAPLELNPAPAIATCEMVTFAFPVLVMATFWTVLVDTPTLPKFRLLVLEFNKRAEAGGTVSVAELLETLPSALLTITLNWAPLSEGEADAATKLDDVALLITAPFFFHWYDKPIPEADTEKLALRPAGTVMLAGCEVITGAFWAALETPRLQTVCLPVAVSAPR
jgi:hypothetical protein